MNSQARSASSAVFAFYYAAIAISAAFMLVPALRTLPFSKVAISLVLLAVLATSVYRGMKFGALRKSLPTLLSESRSGRFFPLALETATGIVVCVAFWMTI
jgi:hypothetical protein